MDIDPRLDRRGFLGLGGLQDVEPAGIAVKGLRAEPLDESDLLRADVERRERDLLATQNAGNDLPEMTATRPSDSASPVSDNEICPCP